MKNYPEPLKRKVILTLLEIDKAEISTPSLEFPFSRIEAICGKDVYEVIAKLMSYGWIEQTRDNERYYYKLTLLGMARVAELSSTIWKSIVKYNKDYMEPSNVICRG